MGTDTTARQNTVIWSATGALILILCGAIGWLINAKDSAILNSIAELKVEIKLSSDAGNQRDMKIMESIAKLCDRVGENSTTLRIHDMLLRQKWEQRQDYFKSPIPYKSNDK
jgi:hypothetical protein